MPTKPTPQQPVKGRARVMFSNHVGKYPYNNLRYNKDGRTYLSPVLVIPCESLKSARARKKWESLTSEQKVEQIANAFARTEGHPEARYPRHYDGAKAVLAVTEGRG